MKTLLFVTTLLSLALSDGQASGRLIPAHTEMREVLQSSSETTGVASWYGGRWIGRKTANGEIYGAGDRTAAHKTLPFGTMVRVTSETSGKSTVVRINNRGPYAKGRAIDLSEVAADELGMRSGGIARVKLEVLKASEVEVAFAVPVHKTRRSLSVSQDRK